MRPGIECLFFLQMMYDFLSSVCTEATGSGPTVLPIPQSTAPGSAHADKIKSFVGGRSLFLADDLFPDIAGNAVASLAGFFN